MSDRSARQTGTPGLDPDSARRAVAAQIDQPRSRVIADLLPGAGEATLRLISNELTAAALDATGNQVRQQAIKRYLREAESRGSTLEGSLTGGARAVVSGKPLATVLRPVRPPTPVAAADAHAAKVYADCVAGIVGGETAANLPRAARLMLIADLRKNGTAGRPGVVWDGPMPVAPEPGRPGNPRVQEGPVRLEFNTVCALAQAGVDMETVKRAVDIPTQQRAQAANIMFGAHANDQRSAAIKQAFWSVAPSVDSVSEQLATGLVGDLEKAYDSGALSRSEKVELSATTAQELDRLSGSSAGRDTVDR